MKSFSAPEARDGDDSRHLEYVVLCVLTVIAWVVLAAYLNESQLNDSLEQFVWGHSLEWGYWKHPPLATWLVWVTFKLFGVHPYATYGLAAVMFAGSLVLTWLCARRLLPAEAALWVPMLLALHYGFTRRAQVYNHNAVVVFFVALAILLLLVALDSGRRRDWMVFGLGAGLALLSKYQAVLPLACAVLVLAWQGRLRASLPGMAWAAAVALAVVAPHLAWLAQHDFSSLTYAMRYVESGAPADRLGRPSSFLVTQLRYFGPVLLFALLVGTWRWSALQTRAVTPDTPAMAPEVRAWLWGLAGLPLALVLASALALGVRLQSHWGLQVTQFLVLALAPWLFSRLGPWNRRCWMAWAAVQAICMAFMTGQSLGLLPYENRNAAVRELPAREITDKAMAFWATQTSCPLKYLSGGHSSAAAIVAAHAGRPLAVLEDGDPSKSPWIDLDDMRASGWLEVELEDQPPAHAELKVMPLQLRSRDASLPPLQRYLVLRAALPVAGCPESAPL